MKIVPTGSSDDDRPQPTASSRARATSPAIAPARRPTMIFVELERHGAAPSTLIARTSAHGAQCVERRTSAVPDVAHVADAERGRLGTARGPRR